MHVQQEKGNTSASLSPDVPRALAGGGPGDISEQHVQQHIDPHQAASANAQLEQDLGLMTQNKQRKSGMQKRLKATQRLQVDQKAPRTKLPTLT